MHYFVFPLDEETRRLAEHYVAGVRITEEAKPYQKDLIELIDRLADTGLEYFFIQTLKEAKVSGLWVRATQTAMRTGKRAILAVGKKIVRRLSLEQLRTVAQVIERSIIEAEALTIPQDES